MIWAVELPGQSDPELPMHGGKPLGRRYPGTSIGWHRKVFELPESDAGKRVIVGFDGAFCNALVILHGYYIGENLSGQTFRASPRRSWTLVDMSCPRLETKSLWSGRPRAAHWPRQWRSQLPRTGQTRIVHGRQAQRVLRAIHGAGVSPEAAGTIHVKANSIGLASATIAIAACYLGLSHAGS